MGNAFAAVALEGGASLGYGQAFGLRLRLVVEGRIAKRGFLRIDDAFQEPDQSGELRLGQTVNQLVSVVAGFVHRETPESAAGSGATLLS